MCETCNYSDFVKANKCPLICNRISLFNPLLDASPQLWLCVPTCLASLHRFLQPLVTFGNKSNRKYIHKIWQFDKTDLAVVGGRVHFNFGMSYVSVSESINKSWAAESETGYEGWKGKRGGCFKRESLT